MMRLGRSSMLEVLDSEFVKFARAKGLVETCDENYFAISIKNKKSYSALIFKLLAKSREVTNIPLK